MIVAGFALMRFAFMCSLLLFLYMLIYDLLSLSAAINTDKDNSEIHPERDEVEEQHPRD